jgi:hypothetical protein
MLHITRDFGRVDVIVAREIVRTDSPESSADDTLGTDLASNPGTSHQ